MWRKAGREHGRLQFTVILKEILCHFLMSSTFQLSPAVFYNGFSLPNLGSNQLSSITCNYIFFNLLDDSFFQSFDLTSYKLL